MPTAWCVCDSAAVFRQSTADTMLSARFIALSAISHPTEPPHDPASDDEPDAGFDQASQGDGRSRFAGGPLTQSGKPVRLGASGALQRKEKCHESFSSHATTANG